MEISKKYHNWEIKHSYIYLGSPTVWKFFFELLNKRFTVYIDDDKINGRKIDYGVRIYDGLIV